MEAGLEVWGKRVPRDLPVEILLKAYHPNRAADWVHEIVEFADISKEHLALVSEKLLEHDLIMMLCKLTDKKQPFISACLRLVKRVTWSDGLKALFRFFVMEEKTDFALFKDLLLKRPEYIQYLRNTDLLIYLNVSFIKHGLVREFVVLSEKYPQMFVGTVDPIWEAVASTDNVEALELLKQIERFKRSITFEGVQHFARAGAVECLARVTTDFSTFESVLDDAVFSGEHRCVQIVLDAHPTERFDARYLVRAIETSTPKIVQLMVRHSPNVVNNACMNAALRRDHVFMLQILLENPPQGVTLDPSLCRSAEMLQYLWDQKWMDHEDVTRLLITRIVNGQDVTAMLRVVVGKLNKDSLFQLGAAAVKLNKFGLVKYLVSYGLQSDVDLFHVALTTSRDPNMIHLLVALAEDKIGLLCHVVFDKPDRDIAVWILDKYKIDMKRLPQYIAEKNLKLSLGDMIFFEKHGAVFGRDFLAAILENNAFLTLRETPLNLSVDFEGLLEIALAKQHWQIAVEFAYKCSDNVRMLLMTKRIAEAVVPHVAEFKGEIGSTMIMEVAVEQDNVDAVRHLLKKNDYTVAFIEETLLPRVKNNRIAFMLEEYVIAKREPGERDKKKAKFAEKRIK